MASFCIYRIAINIYLYIYNKKEKRKKKPKQNPTMFFNLYNLSLIVFVFFPHKISNKNKTIFLFKFYIILNDFIVTKNLHLFGCLSEHLSC